MRFGEKLSILRKQRGMTQMELAEKLDISRQAVSRWEQGISKPSTENLVSIGKLFDVSVDALMNENVQLQAELSVQIAVKDQAPDTSTDFYRGSSRVKFTKQMIVSCFVVIVSVLIVSFCCYGMFGMLVSGQETKEPVPIDELERAELVEDGAGELYLETVGDQ